MLVVDGGSTDRTMGIAHKAGVEAMRTSRGRARQMNAAAARTRGEVLLFLHADTALPPNALERARRAIAGGLDAGAFTLRFDRSEPRYRLAAIAGDLFCRATGDLFGDRAIFVTREAFTTAGGYRDLEIMEDLDLIARLRSAGCRIGLLDGPVRTSSRRIAETGIVAFGLRCLELIGLGWRLPDRATRAFTAGKLGSGSRSCLRQDRRRPRSLPP